MKILDRLPISEGRESLQFGDRYLTIHPNQILVRVSVHLSGVLVPEGNIPEFPALLDAGNHFGFSLQDRHLREWAGMVAVPAVPAVPAVAEEATSIDHQVGQVVAGGRVCVRGLLLLPGGAKDQQRIGRAVVEAVGGEGDEGTGHGRTDGLSDRAGSPRGPLRGLGRLEGHEDQRGE